MGKIRILVVDDAVVFRRLVSEVLSGDPDLEVVGTAPNGRIALAKMTQVNPDLVILDVEMPEMDGLATLAELRKTYPRLPVVMFSALTERGAAATLDALALGATDYFTKPSNCGGLDASLEVIREQMIPSIKALCASSATAKAPAAVARARPTDYACSQPGRIQVVAIATSTGGPNALAEVFATLPADFPVPIVMVQHMPAMFTRLLAERLSARSALRVEEGRSGVTLEPGRAWLAPGDYHMIVVPDGGQVRLLVHQDPAENSCRPAADVLLRSVARAFGPRCLAVILTGMGQDGLRGCESIREAGGQVLAQDEATSVVWGMPGAVVRAGLAHRVLPLSLIGGEIVARVRGGCPLGSSGEQGKR
ncbi:MAG: chemotaxis response regulator protein-glutamate methylesterase [Gemmataceae bacterium]|nr:chemotaxis response regulator protein-glutamate methylesterase [Gemmataceae bacterium]